MSFEYFAEEGFPLGTPLYHQQHLFAGSNDEEIAPSTAPLGPQNQQPDSAYQLYPYDTDVSPSTDPDFFAAVVSPSSSPLPAAHHNYDYLLKRAHLNSLLLPIDQLNLLSLRLAIRLPTLLLSTSNGGIDLEERTVNPRHLFNDQKLTASLLLPALLTLFSSYGHLLNIALHDLVATKSVALNANSTTLPGHSAISTVDNSNMGPITSTTQSVALSVTTSPRITHNNRHSIAGMPAGASASTLALSGGAGHPGSQLYLESESNFAMTAASAPTLKGQSPLSLRRESVTEVTPRFDFVMNDECFNAIHYWLNNAQGELAGPGAEMALENPTGIMKMSPPAHHRRRNSIHMGPPPLTANSIKKKRRKSYNEELVVPILGGTRLPSQRRELESQSLATITGTSSELVIEEDDSAEAFHYESTKNPLTSIGSGSNSGYISGLGTSAGLNVAPPRPLSGSLDNAEFKNGSLSSPGRGDGYLSGPLANLRNSGAPEAPVTPVMPKKTTKSPVIEDDDENEDGKPFPCPECLKQFKRLEHLKRHIRSVHLNIRPFHCKYCEKKFSRSDNLAQHLKTHYKTLPNGNTTIVLGNPNVFNRGKRK